MKQKSLTELEKETQKLIAQYEKDWLNTITALGQMNPNIIQAIAKSIPTNKKEVK